MKQDLINLATQTQRQATRPHQSFWVSASAGTGKTKVLVDRVIRLLLEGILPSQILCLTFTKTASSEMIERVLSTLKSFIHLTDEQLMERLKPFFPHPTTEKLDHARTLFAKVLDKIHTLKIQTIHAFCQSILQKFPIEADLDPSFSMMDDSTRIFYIEQAYETMLKDAFRVNGNVALKQVFEHIAEKMTEFSFDKQKGAILSNFQSFSSLYNTYSLEKICSIIQEKLELKNEDFQKTESDFFDKLPLNVFMVNSDPAVVKILEKIKIVLKEANPSFEKYKTLFLTKKGTVLKKLKHPILIEEAERTKNWDNFQKTKIVFYDTKALLTIAFSFLEKYEIAKKQAGILDFDDLILKTSELLSSSKNLPWVLYKMDGEISHILVDEAQDTSPIQWKIIDALTAEFFTDGANEKNTKTLFVVGDKKQSIYRFQGADVKSFKSSYNSFREKLLQQKYQLTKLPLSISFRTTQDILDLVDSVFEKNHHGVMESDEKITHTSARTHTGRIELWPVFEKEKNDADDKNFLRPTTDKKAKITGEMRFSNQIAERINDVLKSKIVLPSTGKIVQPKDILILLQKRNPLAFTLAKSLKENGIPFEGLDRFTLKDDLAIRDLLACMKFAIFPSDDLNTASLLKSPFFNFSEEEIFTICYDRNDKNIFEIISKKTEFESAKNTLEKLKINRNLNPFEFFSFLLENMDGRYILLKFLGEKHAQAIEEFLTLAFDYSKKSDASLSGFLEYIITVNPSIKREFKKDSLKGVRIMSVHGSKGLESPIVILPDTTRSPKSTKNTIFFDKEGVPFSTAYSENKNEFLTDLVEDEKQQILEENRRLLYVALTRPKDYLIIFGYGTIYKLSWYEVIKEGFEKLDKKTEILFEKEVEIYGCDFKKSEIVLKDKIYDKITEKRKPSFLPVGKEITFPEEENKNAKTGTKIHNILEKLTSIPTGKRVNFIENSIKSFEEKERSIWSESLTKICGEKFRFLFEDSALAEKEIITATGQLLRPDNICFVKDEIWIIDYKTETEKKEISLDYQKQLKKYVSSVKMIYETQKVRAFILWVRTTNLQEISI